MSGEKNPGLAVQPFTKQGLRNLDLLGPKSARNGRRKSQCALGLVPHIYFAAVCQECGAVESKVPLHPDSLDR